MPSWTCRAAAIHQRRGRTIAGAGPDQFPFYLRVQIEGGGGVRFRQTQLDQIAIVLIVESETQAAAVLARPALHRHRAVAHAFGEGLRSSPERGFQPALGGQGGDHVITRGGGQQSQGAIQIGFTAAIGSGDHIEGAQWHGQIQNGTVVANGQRGQHAGRFLVAGRGQ